MFYQGLSDRKYRIFRPQLRYNLKLWSGKPLNWNTKTINPRRNIVRWAEVIFKYFGVNCIDNAFKSNLKP
jgi:hypothetical protein